MIAGDEYKDKLTGDIALINAIGLGRVAITVRTALYIGKDKMAVETFLERYEPTTITKLRMAG